MWSLLRKVGFTFGIVSDGELTSKEEDEFIEEIISKKDTDSYILSEFNNCISEERTGVITHMNGDLAVIDHEYYFTIDYSTNNTFFVNDNVKFTVFFNDTITSIRNVQKIEISGNNEFIDRDSFLQNVICDLGENECTLYGQIVNKCERILEIKLEDRSDLIKVNLDLVKSDFLPSVGDFVSLYATKCNGNGPKNVNVSRIKPYKTALKLGSVTNWTLGCGSISNFAFFSSTSCEVGFDPFISQKVLASLVRSDCKNGYKWRAIQVIPQSNIVPEYSSSEQRKRIENEYRNKQGIFISVSPKVTLGLNTHTDTTIDVTNNSSSEKKMSVYCVSSTNKDQVELMYPSPDKITIKPSQTIEFPFRIHGSLLGSTYSEFIWEFGNFKIRRKISFEVLCDSIPDLKNENISFKTCSTKHISARDIFERNRGIVMPGRRNALNSVFVPVKIGQFLIPNNISNAALPEEKISFDELLLRVQKALPCLMDGLNPRNYQEFMHDLLYLEEIEKLKRVAKMDIEGASFRKHLEYLILNVPEYSPYTKDFLPGDFVLASLPWDKTKKMQGIIHRITKAELWLQFSKSFHESYQEGSSYFISFSTSRTQFRRMHQAIEIAMKHLGPKWLFPDSVDPKPLQVTFDAVDEIQDKTINNTYQRMQNDLSNGITPDPSVNLEKNRKYERRNRMWNRSGAGCGNYFNTNEYNAPIKERKFRKIKWYNKLLNVRQKQAVYRILMGEARPLPYVIFGPPGTGKTVTVVEAILQVHSLLAESRILIATPTNSAADLIAERLIDSGNLQEGDFLRLVAINFVEQGRLTASLIPYSAMASFKDESNNNDNTDDVQSFNRQQISEHRIIVGTIGCLGVLYNMGFPRGFFTHVFIDEAGQLTEPETMIPLAFLSLKNGSVILSGDPLQLGPVVMSHVATRYGLSDSFLVRLFGCFPYSEDPDGYPCSLGFDPRLVTKLTDNYRSLDGILQLFNSLYYKDSLVAKISSESSEEALILKSLKSLKLNFPVLLHGLKGSSIQETNSCSWYNPQEVFQVFTYLNRLYAAGLKPDQIGIITPYQLQVRKIQATLEYYNLETPKLGSVEEFQGQEKMVIILSVVRCLDSTEKLFNCDFVTDPRRMNVAISRARALLIIIGDPELMINDDRWFKALKYCKENNGYIGCELPHCVNLP